jgi:hypothetical protein
MFFKLFLYLKEIFKYFFLILYINGYLKKKGNNTILIIGIEYLKGIRNIIMIIKMKDKNIIVNIGLVMVKSMLKNV